MAAMKPCTKVGVAFGRCVWRLARHRAARAGGSRCLASDGPLTKNKVPSLKPIRITTVLFLLIVSTPLLADIHNPGCDNLEKWSTGYNRDDIWQLTPYVRFPMIARDEKVSPLFGTSVTEWSKDDFAQFREWMHSCQQAAAEQAKQQQAQAGAQQSQQPPPSGEPGAGGEKVVDSEDYKVK